MSTFQPVSTATRKMQVAERIREAIFSGQIPLGAPLRELQVAKELKVSQPTVREALLELENAGFVVRKPNSGTTVTSLTIEELRQRVELRSVLEQMAAKKAARLMKPPGFSELRAILERLSGCIARNEYYQAAQLDLAFHRVIWQASGNDILARTLEQITGPLFAFLSVVRSHGVENLRDAVLSHEPIYAALESGVPEWAAHAVREHIAGSYAPYLDSGFENCMEVAAALSGRAAPAQTQTEGL